MDIILVGGVLIAHFVLIGVVSFIEGYYRKSFSGSSAFIVMLTLAITTMILTISLFGLVGIILLIFTIPITCGVALLVDHGMKGIGSKVKEAEEKSKEIA